MAVSAEDVARIAASGATVSDKIRALDAAGLARAEIARALHKRYQHVRNVLEGDKARQVGVLESRAARWAGSPSQGAAPTASSPSGTQVFRLVVGSDGSIVLPELARAALGVQPGGVAMGRVEGDRLVLMSPIASARLAQALVRGAIPGTDSLADSLIRDRRREALREADA